jgi:hypothetical protein
MTGIGASSPLVRVSAKDRNPPVTGPFARAPRLAAALVAIGNEVAEVLGQFADKIELGALDAAGSA